MQARLYFQPLNDEYIGITQRKNSPVWMFITELWKTAHKLKGFKMTFTDIKASLSSLSGLPVYFQYV